MNEFSVDIVLAYFHGSLTLLRQEDFAFLKHRHVCHADEFCAVTEFEHVGDKFWLVSVEVAILQHATADNIVYVELYDTFVRCPILFAITLDRGIAEFQKFFVKSHISL